MASQAKQVFYVTNPANKRWSVDLKGKTIHYTDYNDELILDISETPSFSSNMSTLNVNNEVDDVHAVRGDHNEELWESVLT